MTRPPPPAAATCNLFCLRARVAGAGAAGSGRGDAPQLRRWCWRGAGRSGALSPARRVPSYQPPARPLAAPSTSASPPRGSAGGGRAPRRDCGAERGPRPPDPRPLGAGIAAVAAGGRGVGPGCGLWRVQARRRRVAAATVTAVRDQAPRCSLPSRHRPSGMLAAPGSPGPPACLEWEGDGAPPPTRTESAASPSQLGWRGDGVRCAAEASPWTGPSSRFPGQERDGWPQVAEGASPPRSTPRGGSPFFLSGVALPPPSSPARSRRLCPRDVGPVPLPGLWQGCSGRKTNLCRRPAAWRRLAACSPSPTPRGAAARSSRLLRWDAFVCRRRREC